MEIRFLQTLLLAVAAAAAAAASGLTHANITAAATGDLALVCALFSGGRAWTADRSSRPCPADPRGNVWAAARPLSVQPPPSAPFINRTVCT
eukprot:COSAG06_NODE_1261_length_10074_cov_21.232882_5_plen_92_part_00